jgi:pimeloyl-ACP methyl ester carboxylesterase
MTADPACGDVRSDEECRRIDSAIGPLHLHIAGNGPPVLFLHGFPEYFGIWRPILDRLAHSRQAILLDLPGFNHSALAQTASPDAASLAKGLVDALAGLGIARFSIVAHDLGGILGWEIAASHRACTEGLVLISAVNPADFIRHFWEDAPASRLPYLDQLTDADPRAYRFDPVALSRLVFRTDEAQRVWLEAALTRSSIATIRALYRANLSPAALANWRGQPPLTCPTLAFYGLADRFLPPAAHGGLASHVAASLDMCEVDRAGHFLPTTQSAQIAARLDAWLPPARL